MFNKIKEKIKGKRMKFDEISDPQEKEYLAKFFCMSCHNHCALCNIRCGRGLAQRDAKVQEYHSKK